MDDDFLIKIEGRMQDVLETGEMTLKYFKEFSKFVRKYRNTNRKEADEISQKATLGLIPEFREIREKMESLFKEFENKIVK